MAAPTIQIVQAVGLGPGLNMTIFDVTGPASYVITTGQSISASLLGLQQVTAVSPMDASQTGVHGAISHTPIGRSTKTLTIRWYTIATGAEAANTTNLSGERVRFICFGV